MTALTLRSGDSTALLGSPLRGPAATVDVPMPTGPNAGRSGWYSLIDILREGHFEYAADRDRRVVACPNDGQPLVPGPDGQLYCPWDGWRPSGGR